MRCWSGLTRGLTLGTEWGTASAPHFALPHPRLLDLRLPVPGPEHGTVLAAGVIFPNSGDLGHSLLSDMGLGRGLHA